MISQRIKHFILSNRVVIVGIFLLILPFLIYRFGHVRYGIGGAQFGDHRALMTLRENAPDEFSFLWRAANFDRYRGNSQSFLFRPGLGLTLGLIDIPFRSNFYVTGAISILVHGIVTLLLFLWLLRLTPFFWATVGSIVFAAHFCGSELVVWRHVNPYAIGLILFVLALNSLRRSHFWGAVTCLFAASLFHETFAAVCLGLTVLLVIPKVRNALSLGLALSGGRLWLLFALPVTLFLLLNLGSFLWVETMVQEGGAYVKQDFLRGRGFAYPFYWLRGFLHLAGASTGDFFVPQLFSTTLDERLWAMRFFGPLFFLLGLFAYRRIERTVSRKEGVLFGIAFLHVMVLFAAYTTMRIMVNGESSIGDSHYYRYFSNFILVLACAALLAGFYRRQRWFRPLSLLVGLLVLNQVYFGVARLYRVGKLSEPRESIVARNLRAAGSYLTENRCFSGNEDKLSENLLPSEFLFRHSCRFTGRSHGITGEQLEALGVVKLKQ